MSANQNWKRRAVGGWITEDGRWAIRGPIFGKRMYWLYHNNERYCPTGKYDSAVSFKSVPSAKRFVAQNSIA